MNNYKYLYCISYTNRRIEGLVSKIFLVNLCFSGMEAEEDTLYSILNYYSISCNIINRLQMFMHL